VICFLDTKKACDKMVEERKERKKKERTPLSVLQPDGTIEQSSTAIDLQSAAKSPMASGSESMLKKTEVKKHTLD
jgi:hypothetical protein